MVAILHNEQSPCTHIMSDSSTVDVELSPRCAYDEIGFISTKHAASRRPRRNVAFLVDELDRDLVEVIEYEKAPSCCAPDLYWSEEEKSEFMNNARQHVGDFVSQYQHRIQRLEIAFFNCTENDLTHQEHKEDMRTMLKWAKSSSRGLEDSVSRAFWESRHDYIQGMLEYFAFLADSCVPSADDELSRFSECRTLRNREFAFKMAMADELTQ